jgi:hypothetical protein
MWMGSATIGAGGHEQGWIPCLCVYIAHRGSRRPASPSEHFVDTEGIEEWKRIHSQPQAINAEKLLRHWLGAIKFRFTVAYSGTASDFASFDAGYGVETPIEIVYHISQLLQNRCSTIDGSPRIRLESKGWLEEAARFF